MVTEADGPALVQLENFSLEFPRRGLGAPKASSNTAHVLTAQRKIRNRIIDDVTLTLRAADSLAIVGPNGAGKTTLLRCIAGLYQPTRGRISVKGRVVSLINWTTGLDMEETGVENLYALGYFLGLGRPEIKIKLEEVIEFSGLGEFIYEPLYTYSAGMVTRLAFALATSVESEILLLDEGIAAGDAEFQGRAQARVQRLLTSARVVVVATHASDFARLYCNRGIYLSSGLVRFEGPVEGTLAAYARDVAGLQANARIEHP